MYRIPDFIDAQTCSMLNDWVDEGVEKKWLDKGINGGASRYDKRVTSRLYANRFNYPSVVKEVMDKIVDRLCLQDLGKSVVGGGRDGVVVSCTFVGGDVYKHTDPKEGLLEVLRCNILTRKPTIGGELYIGDEHIPLEVGELHCYLPSTIEHHVSTVEEGASRIMWMFGFQCSQDRYQQINGVLNG
jgi:hypothetical protein